MAKRIRLKDGSAMEKAFQVQELLSIPEAGKIHKLDEQMSAIYQRNDIPLDEKIRLYEQQLAYFRQLEEKIKKRGGTSVTDGPQQVSLYFPFLIFYF